MALQSILKDKWNNRRSILKFLATAPLAATVSRSSVAEAAVAAAKAAGSKAAAGDIYSSIGVRSLINARGTWTYLSGSLELPEVRRTMELASHHFVDMFELQESAGRYLAKMSGAESGMVTSGSAGAIAGACAACIAGSDPQRIYQLPDTTGMKNEVVMLGSRNPFDSAIRLTGAKIVVAPTVDDLESTLRTSTAMVYNTMFRDDENLMKALKMTKAAGVPMLVDHASGIPPFENFSRYAKLGVDLYCFSGGKGMCGPQDSGILLGRKDLIDAARYNSAPWEGAVCRAMKVGKEEIMGVLAAVMFWSKADLNAMNAEWRARVERIAKLVKTVPGVTTEITIPIGSNSFPTLSVMWDEKKFGMDVMQCAQQLREGEPRIEVLTPNNPSQVMSRMSDSDPNKPHWGHSDLRLQIISLTLQPGEDVIVGNRLRQVLDRARKQSM